MTEPNTESASDEPPTTTERWMYGGARILNSSTVHAWLPEPPPTPECPASLCPKAGGTLELSAGTPAIEVESFSWGAGDGTTVATSDPQEGGEVTRGKRGLSDIPVVKVKDKSSSTLARADPEDGGEVTGPVYTSDPQEGGEVAGKLPGTNKAADVTLKRGTMASGPPRSSARDAASGLATGKRQHKPLAMERGSLFVTMPEGVCVAGARYPVVTLQAGSDSYELSDVTVASCSPVSTARGKKDKAKLDYMVVKMETVLVTG